VNVGLPIGGEGAEGLNGAHQAGPYVIAVENLLETLEDALVGGLGEKGMQGAFAFEKASQHLWNGKDKVAMGNGFQDLFMEFICEQDGALGLARGIKVLV